MCANISYICGCSIGSPPLIVMIDVPRRDSKSIRRLTISRGAGSEVLSYSLQYAHDRLQRRIGTSCARIGCFVESSPRAITPASRSIVEVFFIVNRRRSKHHSSFFLFVMRTGILSPQGFGDGLRHSLAGESLRFSVAGDQEQVGGVEGFLDAEIFLFARNPRLPFFINQAFALRPDIAEPDFDPAINRVFSQFKKSHLRNRFRARGAAHLLTHVSYQAACSCKPLALASRLLLQAAWSCARRIAKHSADSLANAIRGEKDGLHR